MELQRQQMAIRKYIVHEALNKVRNIHVDMELSPISYSAVRINTPEDLEALKPLECKFEVGETYVVGLEHNVDFAYEAYYVTSYKLNDVIRMLGKVTADLFQANIKLTNYDLVHPTENLKGVNHG